jgi:hypothetical protein
MGGSYLCKQGLESPSQNKAVIEKTFSLFLLSSLYD